MKSIFVNSACLCAALTLCAQLLASEPADDPRTNPAGDLEPGLLPVEVLVDWVVEANPGVAALAAAAEAARHRIDAAGSLDDPMLSYGVAPRTLDSGRVNQRFEFSQRIPWPGTLDARETVARFAAAAAAGDREARELEVIAQARSAHAQWWLAGEALAIHHAAEELVEELIATASARYAAGLGLKQDLLQAQVERANLDNEEFRLLQLRTAARSRINALLNRPPDTPLPPASPPAPVREPPAFEALRGSALERHPELARIEARLAANQTRITLAEKAFYPDFQLGVGYNGLWDDTDKRPTIGVAINVPLDRSKRRSELAAARADADGSQWALVERRAELLDALARARAAAVEAWQSVRVHERDLLPLADEYLRSALADYQSGAGAFFNVIDAEQRKLATELALARARAESAVRMAELRRAAAIPRDGLLTDMSGAQP